MTGAARKPAAAALERAVVVRVDFGSCTLRADDGRLFVATVRGRLMGVRKALGNAVIVGDIACYGVERERTIVSDVVPRRNVFSRRASGERLEEQIVAANLDQIVLVASLQDPEFKPGFADRVFAQAAHQGIPARLVLNKVDVANRDEARSRLDDYAHAGVAGLAVSAKTGEEVDHLRQVCRGRRTLFVGHSGVGKSTLLNTLAPRLELVVGEVNRVTGKGRHTTTAAWLVRPEPDLELIDTPGVRSFGLWGIGPRDLDQAYLEFRPLLGECRFADCRHDREPGCALHAAARSGAIAPRRLESYQKLREELEAESAATTRGRGRARGGG